MWIRINKLLLFFIIALVSNLAFSSQVFKIQGENYYLSHLYLPSPIQLEFTTPPLVINDHSNRFNHHTGIYKFASHQESLQEILLKKGQAIFYPDSSLDSYWYQCLWQAEQYAIRNNIGIWQKGDIFYTQFLIPNSNLKFVIFKGKISKISLYQNNFYINLNKNKLNKLVIMLPKNLLKSHKIKLKNYHQLIGQQLTLRGWIHDSPTQTYLIPSNYLMLHLEEK